ncbi:hypothetical protein RHSIM_Rhsim10G0062000 [Rhododendron simsii]|uniref:Uncharacterized protein n=1 Tax=Rhododendron simsii TaxID=118357 RepID=A0A834GG21_RHOSS|nr:hypothetical protein RHSIM_Rhsim10G0062000 [Rhododendron simsii]
MHRYRSLSPETASDTDPEFDKTLRSFQKSLKATRERPTSRNINFDSGGDLNIFGYSDSDWGRDLDERKSTTGFVFFIGDTAFTWTSKKQAIVMLSSYEAEYITANSAVCLDIWLRNVLKHLGFLQELPTKIYVDNRSAIALAKNPTYHERSKHIDTHYHFIREHVKAKEVELVSCRTNDQAADIFTKPLKHEAFVEMKTMLGMKNL